MWWPFGEITGLVGPTDVLTHLSSALLHGAGTASMCSRGAPRIVRRQRQRAEPKHVGQQHCSRGLGERNREIVDVQSTTLQPCMASSTACECCTCMPMAHGMVRRFNPPSTLSHACAPLASWVLWASGVSQASQNQRHLHAADLAQVRHRWRDAASQPRSWASALHVWRAASARCF